MGGRLGPLANLAHLASRFAGSLSPRDVAPADRALIASVLGPRELALFEQLDRADRTHAAGVARRVQQRLGDGVADAVLAAALLHDVGKLRSGLGVWGRVGATLLEMAVGHQRLAGWADAPGRRGRVGRYATHDRLGAALLAEIDADPLVVAWAREHHLDAGHWTVPADVGEALVAADDDGGAR